MSVERPPAAIVAAHIDEHHPRRGRARPGAYRHALLAKRPTEAVFLNPKETDMDFTESTSPAPGPHLARATPVVFVVDDDICVRESLESLIHCEGWKAEVFASAQEFLDRPRLFAPSCLVLDVTLPDLNGLDLQRHMADRPDMPIIFITGRGDVPTTVQAMKAGAIEFLTKPFDCEALLNAIRLCIALSHAELGREAEQQALRDHYATLSRREREVMALVVRGRLNKQVGGELGISEITVKAHRGKMMRKMRADSFADLVNMATKLRILHFTR